ncbi:hypothetical protein PG997_007333 [Apiospora hydei]|uniref:Uncharacterized protein n=1 Tax=Apiospora hydei TaxID=1337664 RepID=A0ABR1W7Q0_9PEZI
MDDNPDAADDYSGTEASNDKGSNGRAATQGQYDAFVAPSTSGESNGEEDSVESSDGKENKGKATEGGASKGKEAAVPRVVITPSHGEKEISSGLERYQRDLKEMSTKIPGGLEKYRCDIEDMSKKQLWTELDKFSSAPPISVATNTQAAPKEGKDFEARSLSELKAKADEAMDAYPGPDEGIPGCFKRVHSEFEDMPLAEVKVEAKKFMDMGSDLHLSIDQMIASSTPLPDGDDPDAPRKPQGRRTPFAKVMGEMIEQELADCPNKELYHLLMDKLGFADEEAAATSSSNTKKQQGRDPKTVTDIPGLNITEFMLEDYVYDRPRPAATTIPTFDTLYDSRSEDLIRDYIHTWNSLAALYDRQNWVTRRLLLPLVVRVLSGAWFVLLWRIGAGPAPVPFKARWKAVKRMLADPQGTLWWLAGTIKKPIAPKDKQLPSKAGK